MLFAHRTLLLERRLVELPSLLVAVSGGVDSAVLLAVAARVVPGRVAAGTAVSASVPDEEVAAAAALARSVGVPHHVVSTRELEDERYRRNAGDRCYFCRQAMYYELTGVAAANGISHVADGLLFDDNADDRPGVLAATEHGILHPLRDTGFCKPHVRRLAWGLVLAVHAKPSQPCLASRLPRGVAVSAERLARVHRAETALRTEGFAVLRVRCEERHGRIEIGLPDLSRAVSVAARLEALVVAAGFDSASLDPRGYRGSVA